MEYLDGILEVKELTDKGEFSGYASVFNNEDHGGDVVMAGAFAKSISAFQEGKIRPKMLWQHNPNNPIGVWTAFKEDDRGLRAEGRISLKSQKGAETYALLADGAIDSLSIGYKTIDSEYKKKEDGNTIRLLKELELWEVSLVTFPMNAEALVTDVKQLQSPREVEHLLREAGVPGTFAKLVSLHGYDEAVSRLNNSRRDGGIDEAEEQAARLLKQLQGLKEAFNA